LVMIAGGNVAVDRTCGRPERGSAQLAARDPGERVLGSGDPVDRDEVRRVGEVRAAELDMERLAGSLLRIARRDIEGAIADPVDVVDRRRAEVIARRRGPGGVEVVAVSGRPGKCY